MIKENLKIKNKLGMHARPASLLVKTANQFNCDIIIKKDEKTINAKSILGVMMLAAEYDSTIEVIVDGSDEKEAFNAIKTLVDNKFDEN